MLTFKKQEPEGAFPDDPPRNRGIGYRIEKDEQSGKESKASRKTKLVEKAQLYNQLLKTFNKDARESYLVDFEQKSEISQRGVPELNDTQAGNPLQALDKFGVKFLPLSREVRRNLVEEKYRNLVDTKTLSKAYIEEDPGF